MENKKEQVGVVLRDADAQEACPGGASGSGEPVWVRCCESACVMGHVPWAFKGLHHHSQRWRLQGGVLACQWWPGGPYKIRALRTLGSMDQRIQDRLKCPVARGSGLRA